MLVFLSLLLPFLSNLAYGIIIPVQSLTPIAEVLNQADSNTLLIFDVDCTLLIPKDRMLRPCGEEFFLKAFEDLAPQVSEARLKFLMSSILLQRSLDLVNPQTPQLIQSLQKREIKVIAMSALLTGRFGAIGSMEDWCEKELLEFGFNFSNAFPRYNHIIFGDLKREQSFPIYKNGILFCSRHPKGEVLSNFLRRVKWLPKRIIYIDDMRVHLESVEAHMEGYNIDCLCFHYRQEGIFQEKLDKKIAEKQINHLRTHEEWLTDSQAQGLNTVQDLQEHFLDTLYTQKSEPL